MNILECSVCFERFDLDRRRCYTICQSGHNLCRICRSSLKCKTCPLCRENLLPNGGVVNLFAKEILYELGKYKPSCSIQGPISVPSTNITENLQLRCECSRAMIRSKNRPRDYANSGNIYCNGCRIGGLQDDDYFYHCSPCKYDLCKVCSVANFQQSSQSSALNSTESVGIDDGFNEFLLAEISEEAVSANQSSDSISNTSPSPITGGFIDTCPLRHQMMQQTGKPLVYSCIEGVSIVCDCCRRRRLQNDGFYFHCAICGYDLCITCATTDGYPTSPLSGTGTNISTTNSRLQISTSLSPRSSITINHLSSP